MAKKKEEEMRSLTCLPISTVSPLSEARVIVEEESSHIPICVEKLGEVHAGIELEFSIVVEEVQLHTAFWRHWENLGVVDADVQLLEEFLDVLIVVASPLQIPFVLPIRSHTILVVRNCETMLQPRMYI